MSNVVDGFDFCALGQQMSNSTYFRILLAIRIVICFAGIALCGSMLLSRLNSVILHVHARIIIKYHVFITFLLSVNYLWVSMFELVRNSQRLAPCDYLMPRWLSFFPHFITANLVYCQLLSCMMITIERLVCTFKIRNYENVSRAKSIILALVLMTASVIAASYLSLAHTADWEQKMFFLSFKDTKNRVHAIVYLSAQLFCDLVTVVLCKIVDVLNRRTKKNFVNGLFNFRKICPHNQLSSKLQIRENIALSNTWMPIILVHLTLTAVSVLVIGIVIEIGRSNYLTAILIAETVACLFPLYTVIMPMFIFRKHPSLFWSLVERLCKRQFRRVDVAMTAKKTGHDFDQHFEWFNQMVDHKPTL